MDPKMPSTSTQNRFSDAYKSTFLKQVYNKELHRFDPSEMELTSPYNQRRFRRLKLKADGTIVARPRTALPFSPVKKHPTTVDLCRPVGLDGYRRTLLLPSARAAQQAQLEATMRTPGRDESVVGMLERREQLQRELNRVHAEIGETEAAVQPVLDRMVRTKTMMRPSSAAGGVGSARASARSRPSARASARASSSSGVRASARGSSARMRASARSALAGNAGMSSRYTGRSGGGMASGRRSGRGSARPSTAMSFSSIAPNFSWQGSFQSTYSKHFQQTPDVALRRNYMSMKRRRPAAKVDVVRLVPQSPETRDTAEPALSALAASTKLFPPGHPQQQ